MVQEGLFKYLAVDYVDEIKSVQGKCYMLVIIDCFSHWVEAVPSKDLGSETVIKFLTREVIPRFGIPSEINSDNSSTFAHKVDKVFYNSCKLNKGFQLCITQKVMAW